MTPVKYRPDIDGLRAIAVLSVLFYHVGFSVFKGGFIGVDVFFVISGFLITRLIKDELLETGRFRFLEFYARRARRLFPSLFFTLSVSMLLAVILFSPPDLERFGGALLHAVMSLSNFYFWNESGYFDATASIKPLLHTWSLSVEEQFYLTWPFLIWLLLLKTKKAGPLIALSAIGVFSFLLNIEFADGKSALASSIFPSQTSGALDGRATIFYLTPFRVFEFVIGALLVWIAPHQPRNKIILEPFVIIGLALIAYPLFVYTEETLFPTYNAIMPCMGAALLIYSGAGAQYAGRILNNRAAVLIGLISYSLYLIHWPIIVFYKYYKLSDLSGIERILVCLISVVGAWLMFRYIEKPFRRRAPGQRSLSSGGFAISCLFLALVVIFPAANVWANNGWPWRFAGIEDSDILKLDALRQQTIAYNRQNIVYPTFTVAKNRTLVVGDSHATDISNGLHRKLSPDFQVRVLNVDEKCWKVSLLDEKEWAQTDCREQLNRYSKALTAATADIIVIANWYSTEDLEYLNRFMQLIAKVNRSSDSLNIVFMGKTVGFGRNFHHEAIRMLQQGRSVSDINAIAYENFYSYANEIDALSLKIVEKLPTISYVSRTNTICSESTCDFLINKNNVLVWDGSHLSLNGVDLVTDRIIQQHPELFRPQ